MELAVLNDMFLPSRPIEGHSSLIWTERYSTAGDFSRESEDIGGTLAMLPIEDPDNGIPPTFVTLRDSNVPMVVETHKIEKAPNQPPKITTTGRSMETVLDRRTTIHAPLGGGQKAESWTSVQKSSVDSAYDVMNQVVTLGLASVSDMIPELDIKAPLRPPGYVAPTSDQNFSVDPGELYAWVLAQIQADNYGFRAVRPADLASGKVSLEIYTGTDRTKNVVFDVRFDQFDNATYLLSKAAWKNVDQVNAAADSLEVTDGVSRTGLARRVVYQDATSTATGPAGAALTSIMQNLGMVDLAKQLPTALFSGEVSRQLGSLYGKDYFLGDIVKITGDYALSQFVRIAEFIRTEDNTGEKAYPTFASL